jgi:hypothetical protein
VSVSLVLNACVCVPLCCCHAVWALVGFSVVLSGVPWGGGGAWPGFACLGWAWFLWHFCRNPIL